MNCKQFKEKSIDILAGGENTLPTELSAHRQACADCRAFFEAQAAHFRSIDAGLFAAANPAVPPSFLPGVRARWNEQAAAPRAWFPAWKLSAIGAAVAVAIIVGLFWHRPLVPPGLPQPALVTSQQVRNLAPVVQLPASQNSAVPSRAPRSKIRAAAPALSVGAEPEVLVLPEEREAFARFVATLRVQKDVALALTRPAPAREDVAVEIVLMDFGNVEVKPLESEAGE